MAYKTFGHWLRENADIFGFDAGDRRHEIQPMPPKLKDEPVDRVNIEEVVKGLARYTVGEKQPHIAFVGEVRWGWGTGSIRVATGSRMKLVIERLGHDLEGNSRWFTEKIYQINRAGFGGHEESIIHDVLGEVKKIDERPMPSPNHEYDGLENFVSALANSYKRTARDIFLYEGIKKVDDENYIIRMAVRGSGVEHQDQRRVLENQTFVNFSPSRGVLRIFNYNVESPVGNAPQWRLMPSDVDWYFTPNQSRDEILEALSTHMHWY